MKLIQYLARFLSYQLLDIDPESDLGGRLKLLYKGISTNRKAYRLGMFVDEFKKFEKTLASAKEDVKKKLNLVKSFCMAMFYLHDNISWLLTLKVIKGDKDPIKLRASRFRFTAAIVTTITGIMDISATQKKITSAAPGSKERIKAEEKQGNNTVGMVKNICDLLVHGNNSKYIEKLRGSKYDDGTIGLLGSMSAIAALYQLWVKL